MLSTTVGRFRVVSIAEGCSFIALLLLGSVLSRISDIDLVMPLGVLHAVLVFAYLGVLVECRLKLGWDPKTVVLALVAMVLPFGPFVFDAKMKHKLVEPTPATA